jgi:hypothetical protein
LDLRDSVLACDDFVSGEGSERLADAGTQACQGM